MANNRQRALGGSARPLTLQETADYLNVPVSTMYKKWREWGLPAHRTGRSIKFLQRDVAHWLESHRA